MKMEDTIEFNERQIAMSSQELEDSRVIIMQLDYEISKLRLRRDEKLIEMAAMYRNIERAKEKITGIKYDQQ